MPAPEFTVNVNRYDPYKNYRFRLYEGTTAIAGVSKVSALTRTTEVVKHREGGDPSVPRKSPGQSDFSSITLERGVTHDNYFYVWASMIWNYQNSTVGMDAANSLISLANFRKNLILNIYNEAGQQVLGYNLYRCWVSEFTAIPEHDANANAVSIQTLKIETEGWDQDFKIKEPTEVQFVPPTGG